MFKNSDIEVTEEEKYKYDVKSLQEECAKDKPSKTRVKTLLKDTLAIRHNWIDKEGPTVDEILENFPPLKMSSSYVRCGIRPLQFNILFLGLASPQDRVGRPACK